MYLNVFDLILLVLQLYCDTINGINACVFRWLFKNIQIISKNTKKNIAFCRRRGIINMLERLIGIILMHEVKNMEILRTKIKGIRNISDAFDFCS